MRKPLSLSVVVINLVLLASLVAIWMAFAPTLIGGRASYVVVNGNSMEPGFHRGDLVIVQAASIYNVGDIAIYRNAELNAFVIHRIIAMEQDHYVFKGDNNSWIDTYRPNRAELIGKLWIHLPELGKAMEWLRLPINMGLTTGLLGGILMASTMNPHRKRRNKPSGNYGGMLEGGLYIFGFFVLVFLGLSILFFLRPLTRNAEKIGYIQESQFSYSATGTPVIYDTDTVRSGEPVFPKLTCFLNIGFTYTLLGNNVQAISGSHQLIARVMDEQSGWQRTIPMNEITTFSGNSFFTTSTLDLCQIISLVNTLEQETGLRANNYMLEIVPQVTVTAIAVGNQITDSFEPKLVFKFDDVHFSLFTPKGQDNPLHLSKQGFAINTNVEANTLSVFRWQPTILSIRVISLLGLVLSLIGLLILSIPIFASSKESQETLIRLKYGALLVNVYDQNIELTSALINVTSIDELAKLAERHNTVILHMTLNFMHSYLVQCNGINYRYVSSSSHTGAYEIEPPRQETIRSSYTVKPTNIMEIGLEENELFGYVLDKSRISKGEVEETIILRKIRL
jgi:signal peptidase I